MTTTAEPTIEPTLQLPARYQLRAILKETPSTSVYRVFDAASQQDEAIKILRHELSEPQQLLRFKTEFSTLASLEHESIVKVREYGLLHDRFPYFTMEYFAGKKISEYFDGHSWPALYDVILQIAFDGIGAFEIFQFVRRGVRHRHSVRTADQGIAIEIHIARSFRFCML